MSKKERIINLKIDGKPDFPIKVTISAERVNPETGELEIATEEEIDKVIEIIDKQREEMK